MKKNNTKLSGFTLIELIVSMAIIAIFTGIITISLINIEPRSSLTTTAATLISDIKLQQLKAMTGGIKNNAASEFGVFFENDKYILFSGINYTPADPSNTIVSYDENIRLTSINFPGSQIVFNRIKGEISGFIPESDSLTLKNLVSNDEQTLTFNKLGAVISLN